MSGYVCGLRDLLFVDAAAGGEWVTGLVEVSRCWRLWDLLFVDAAAGGEWVTGLVEVGRCWRLRDLLVVDAAAGDLGAARTELCGRVMWSRVLNAVPADDGGGGH